MTWDDVIALAPALSTVSATRQAQILAEVALEVDGTAWGDYAASGSIYLAAHKGAVTLQGASGGAGVGAGPVTSESIGPFSRSYASAGTYSGEDAQLGTTSYGREFMRLRSIAIGVTAFVA